MKVEVYSVVLKKKVELEPGFKIYRTGKQGKTFMVRGKHQGKDVTGFVSKDVAHKIAEHNKMKVADIPMWTPKKK